MEVSKISCYLRDGILCCQYHTMVLGDITPSGCDHPACTRVRLFKADTIIKNENETEVILSSCLSASSSQFPFFCFLLSYASLMC